ncbi:ubiquitin carboxyl-terminal hydrolase MINDY-1-like isoform X1 [Cucurbita moschata]|uniref:Ubiquitin carboxyl-terminal hydrolase MINDY-1-like isoform X1 n=1 Tax=Cucurbita moschata TaxID=3662 RepID=A0A6J1H4V0_CUCMO|nr:ubiquitin carboxyl-terminal hydrolase MINDY-1-like isoform X1 [Cucurbita moschata]
MASPSSSEDPPNPPLEQQQQQPPKEKENECLYKTKTIQFLGRSTPIVLQNDNGPCPLLAICNVLLLRNNLNLGPDATEVSQEKLLSLVAERLIDSNSNVDNKDAGFVENQQQNIADAIDLLPRLATGIDVNIRFRRIDDFEFTPECAIFDLLDIPLYHGWIVDPQDHDTASAIGSKSYNAIMEELVALETQHMEDQCSNNPEDDCIDFVAATTATLGVPSPSLSKNCSFDESPRSVSDEQRMRKGDLEEEAELLRALKLSESVTPISMDNHGVVDSVGDTNATKLDEEPSPEKVSIIDAVEKAIIKDICAAGNNLNQQPSLSIEDSCRTSLSKSDDEGVSQEQVSSSPLKADVGKPLETVESEGHKICPDMLDNHETLIETDPISGRESSLVNENTDDISHKNDMPAPFESVDHKPVDKEDSSELLGLSSSVTCTDSADGKIQCVDVPGGLTSTVGSEPMYEGEECILDARSVVLAAQEPVYEGEVVLAEQGCGSSINFPNVPAKDEISPKQGELIRNFLKNNASQLTFYGLFSLQDGLKERELCVFFRNNHFSTMFKLDGQLYLLATDQGYIHQPDLVWEKLNEVNGDTLFMTGNFKEFKVESHSNESWDEHNAMASTADYLASIDATKHAGLDLNSDLQLAIALQQQEFEQQPQRQNVQQPSTGGSSRLVVGPQVSKSSGKTPPSSSARTDAKPKEKCSVM